MSIVDVMLNSMRYKCVFSQEQKQRFQEKQLQRLVSRVRAESPALKKLYADLPEHFTLQDLPVTNKQMIMEHYDEWVTDRRIKKADLKEFLSDRRNIGKPYLGKYLIVTTSGSSGIPLYFVLNKKSINVSTCSALLSHALSEKPVALMYPMKQFLIPTSMIMENMRRFPRIMERNYILIDAMMPREQLVQTLNRMQPRALYSYPTMMELLTDEAVRGNLNISIREVVCASEKLTEKTRQYIENTFNCRAKSIYGCTEGGNIAYECPCHHLHLNNPYVILEPVDEHNRPVPPGQHAHKLLLTNLANDVVPIIRYELMDSAVLHTEGCACGDSSPWLEIEGRTAGGKLEFRNGVQIAPVVLYFLIETMDTLRRFQIVLHPEDRLEFRAVFMPDVDQEATFAEVQRRILGFLEENGVSGVEIYLSDQAPTIDPVTFKFRSVYQEKT